LYTEWVGLETLPLRTSTTVSDRLGEWPRNVVWIVALAWIAAALVSRRRRT